MWNLQKARMFRLPKYYMKSQIMGVEFPKNFALWRWWRVFSKLPRGIPKTKIFGGNPSKRWVNVIGFFYPTNLDQAITKMNIFKNFKEMVLAHCRELKDCYCRYVIW